MIWSTNDINGDEGALTNGRRIITVPMMCLNGCSPGLFIGSFLSEAWDRYGTARCGCDSTESAFRRFPVTATSLPADRIGPGSPMPCSLSCESNGSKLSAVSRKESRGGLVSPSVSLRMLMYRYIHEVLARAMSSSPFSARRVLIVIDWRAGWVERAVARCWARDSRVGKLCDENHGLMHHPDGAERTSALFD